MNNRIFNLRKILNLTQNDFANTIGMQGGTLSDIEHGKTTITNKTIIAICAKFNVNETWLRTGEGEMFNTVNLKYEEFFKIYNQLNPPLQDFLLTTAKELLKTQFELNL